MIAVKLSENICLIPTRNAVSYSLLPWLRAVTCDTGLRCWRAAQGSDPASQYNEYKARSWYSSHCLRNSAGTVMLHAGRMHFWLYVFSFSVYLHLCFFVHIKGPQWWIGMFLFPLDVPDRPSILEQFGSALRTQKGWEKRWATQLTVALMKDSSEAPGSHETWDKFHCLGWMEE